MGPPSLYTPLDDGDLMSPMHPLPDRLIKISTAIMALLIAACLTAAGASAAISVRPGESIQAAIDSAPEGETVQISGGEYRESLILDRPVTLRGITSEGSLPHIQTESGPAITIAADGVVVEGLWATSASGWTADAGFLVQSDDNIIRGCMASGCGNVGILIMEAANNTISGDVIQGNGKEGVLLKNCSGCLIAGNDVRDNRYGCKLQGSDRNRIYKNTFLASRFDAICLLDSDGNLIEGNYATGGESGLYLDGCRDNIVTGNDFIGNEKGIYISFLEAAQKTKSREKGVVISYNAMPSEKAVSTNNTIYSNNLSNEENAYDDGQNNWDDGRTGNNYSDFNDPEEGCEGIRICDSEHAIPGGSSVDRYPRASPRRIEGKAEGSGGAAMQLFGKSYLPGSRMDINFTAPVFSVWAVLTEGPSSGGVELDSIYLGINTSGDAVLAAPEKEGSYELSMQDANGSRILSLPFNVTVPVLKASPNSVLTCEKITVSFSGAFGGKSDWIGMYKDNSSQAVERQPLSGRESGSVTFAPSQPGSYIFKLFLTGASAPAAQSNAVLVKATSGHKVIAEPSRVSPGGVVTVTFWGAPLSGTGVIGMYGMTRPDKFDLGKKAIGARSCGSMTWQLPSTPGQYDFRMFQDDINRPLLAQSNVVTVA